MLQDLLSLTPPRGIHPGHRASRPGFAEAHLNRGNTLKNQGQLDAAIDAYRRSIESQPDYAVAHHNLGNALKDQAQLEAAMECYRRAVELKPDDAELHSSLVYAALFHPGSNAAAIAAETARWEFRHGAPVPKIHAETRPRPQSRTPAADRLRLGGFS